MRETDRTLFPKQSVCHRSAVALFCKHSSDLLQCAAVTQLAGHPGPQTDKPEEISVPCQPTASADGTEAFSLLPADSRSLIFHTKL